MVDVGTRSSRISIVVLALCAGGCGGFAAGSSGAPDSGSRATGGATLNSGGASGARNGTSGAGGASGNGNVSASCGNNVVDDPNEACDGTAMPVQVTCAFATGNPNAQGFVGCNAACKLDTSTCVVGLGAGGVLGSGGIMFATGGVSAGGALGAGGGSAGGTIGAGGASTGGASTGGSPTTCQPILNQAGLDTGFDSCSDGSKHRRAALVCPTEKTTATSPCTTVPPTCVTDANCTQQPLGYCADAHHLAGYCGCFYGCQRDSDCGPGHICDCGVVVGKCVSATCTTDADCGAGFGCVGTIAGTPGTSCNTAYPPPATTYVCQTASDLCRGDKDCPSAGAAEGKCFLNDGRLACGLLCLPTP